jgi:hypothetical protein
MAALVNLESDSLTVEPGRTATTEFGIQNTGTIVEQFTIMLLGDVAPWARSDPPVVSLFPGAQQTVTIQFSPPRDYTTPSGEVPFGVKVIPSNEPDESVTEEGLITVGSFTDVGAELVPRVATGRLAGHQKLAVDSRGNIPLPVTIGAIDASDALKFHFRPQKLTTAPGEARYVRVRITPRQRFWRGHAQHKPYQVQVMPENESALVLEGSLTQKPVLPRWFLPALLIAGLLLLLWFLVLKPIVHNDAVNANKAALAAQQAQTKALANQVATASQQAQTANAAAAAAVAIARHKPVPAVTTTSSTTTTTVVKAIVRVAKPTTTTIPKTITTLAAPSPQAPPVVGPNEGQIEVVAPAGGVANNAYTVPSTSSLQKITDVVIENVSGGGGRALLHRVRPGPAASGGGTQRLLVENLTTLTDQEYQFSTPIQLSPGDQLVLSVACAGAQEIASSCDVSVYFTGVLTSPPEVTTTVP